MTQRAVRRMVTGAPQGMRYLVYRQYDLVPSPTADLLPSPDGILLEEHLRQHPQGAGRCVVEDDDGNVIDEFRG